MGQEFWGKINPIINGNNGTNLKDKQWQLLIMLRRQEMMVGMG